VNDEKKKILIVDNQPIILKYVSDLLEKKGYRVKTAEDGLGALDAIKEFIPDFFLLDLIMPNIDGATLCGIIRQNPRFQHTPVFILSAIAAEYTCNLKELGADLCIAKGPLPEMGNHILDALAHSGRVFDSENGVEVVGVENLYPRQATKELVKANRHYEDIFEHVSDGILEISRDGRIVFANSAAATCLSSTKESLLGTDFLSWFDGPIQNAAAHFIEIPQCEEKTNSLRLGEKFLSIKAIPMKTDAGIRVILLKDVTTYELNKQALEEANKELITLARTDPLTRIANRRWFDERLKEEWKRMSREKSHLSLLLCDVDNLKALNDEYGHAVGDECLKRVAQTLAEQTKRPADFAARYGGDEFALVLPNTSSNGAIHIADQIRRQVFDMGVKSKTRGKIASISLSIGIASASPGAGNSVELLLSVADDSMYQAKNQGRNRVVSRNIDKQHQRASTEFPGNRETD